MAKMAVTPEVGFISNPSADHMSNLRGWTKDFASELTLYTDKMPQNWTPEIWWDYQERTLLGFLVSGMARNPENKDLVILQEFAVKDDNQSGKKRADLYVQKGKNGYLIETKYQRNSPGQSHFESISSEETYSKAMSQVREYYKTEEKWYDYLDNVTLVVIYFQPLHFNSNPKVKFEHINNAALYRPTLQNSFYTLIDPAPGEESTMLEIFGRIEEVELPPKPKD